MSSVFGLNVSPSTATVLPRKLVPIAAVTLRAMTFRQRQPDLLKQFQDFHNATQATLTS